MLNLWETNVRHTETKIISKFYFKQFKCQYTLLQSLLLADYMHSIIQNLEVKIYVL